MYNLTVDEAHTFFVGNGDWLVHNTDPCYVAFKAQLNKGIDFPGDLRGLSEKQFNSELRKLYFNHNKAANQQVYEALQANPAFRQIMEQNHPDIVEWVQPLPRGGFRRNPPPDWNWHHVPDREGEMWLITVADHLRLRKELHVQPHNRGGMELWGIIR